MSRARTRLVEGVEAAGFDERVVYAMLPASSDAKVRRTVYQQDADLSDQQAIRDIRELVAGSSPTARPVPATTPPALP